MKVSKRTDYALRVLFHLVGAVGDGPVPLSTLVEPDDIPRRFLEQIMLELKKYGWVDSTPGRYGGYLLAKRPEEITLGAVVRAFDGVLAPLGCVSTTSHQACSQQDHCRFRRVFLDVRNETARIMDSATLSAVFVGPPVRRSEVFDQALIGGAGI